MLPVSFLLGGYKWGDIEKQYLDEDTIDEVKIVGHDDISFKDVEIIGNRTLKDVIEECEPNTDDACFDDVWDHGGQVNGTSLCESVIEIYKKCEEPMKKKQKISA